jgi:hypothetical protein
MQDPISCSFRAAHVVVDQEDASRAKEAIALRDFIGTA